MPVAPGNRTAESGQAAADRFVTASSHASRSVAARHASLDCRWQISDCRARRSLAEDFQMPGIAAVDALEVPRARDDFCAASTLTRPSATLSLPMGEGTRARSRLQQEERFHIDLPAAENLPLFRQRIGRDPQLF
jgi:hypothetical protein